MSFANSLNCSRLGLVAALAGSLAVGCGGSSADEALNKAMTDAGKNRDAVYPLAGKVTIDRDPPKFESNYRLVVVLNDPDKPDIPVIQRPYVEAETNGQFTFSTYKSNDGVKPGKYIVTFGVFRHHHRLGLIPPDQLHNLYNNPDENAKNPEFVINHKAPGKKDYEFNLQVMGKEAAELGAHALNGVMEEHDPGAARYRKKQ